MRIESLQLVDFKNHAQAAWHFETPFTCLTGPNGVGKTNLLDAVYYCGFCRSVRTGTEGQNVRHGAAGFRVAGRFSREARSLGVELIYRSGQGKTLRVNGEDMPRLADHIGALPMVFLSPEDQALVDGYAEDRRKFMDASLAQVSRPYLEALMRYNRALSQRNVLLKRFRDMRTFDQALLDSFDPTMDAAAAILRTERQRFLTDLVPVFQHAYARLCDSREKPGLSWSSNWGEHDSLVLAFRSAQRQDEGLARTTLGPHRDDLTLTLDGHPAKRLGSQGQKKTLLLALRLAQASWLEAHLGFAPLLLLDDVFDKLDRDRVRALFALLGERKSGQVLLSDTNANRVELLLSDLGLAYQHVPIGPAGVPA